MTFDSMLLDVRVWRPQKGRNCQHEHTENFGFRQNFKEHLEVVFVD